MSTTSNSDSGVIFSLKLGIQPVQAHNLAMFLTQPLFDQVHTYPQSLMHSWRESTHVSGTSPEHGDLNPEITEALYILQGDRHITPRYVEGSGLIVSSPKIGISDFFLNKLGRYGGYVNKGLQSKDMYKLSEPYMCFEKYGNNLYHHQIFFGQSHWNNYVSSRGYKAI